MPNWVKNYPDKEKARQMRNKHRKANYDKTAYAPNGWKKWTPQEDEIVLQHRFCDRQLSCLLKRSVAAIQKRRSKLKKKENNNE